jgi:GntR family transcriptional repressor for pyruvate dehydrogenase complex
LISSTTRCLAELEPIRRSPLCEEVVERLRSFIDVQQLQPGDRLLCEPSASASAVPPCVRP